MDDPVYVVECLGQRLSIADEPTVDDALQVALNWLEKNHERAAEATFATERGGVRTAYVVLVADEEGGWGFGAKIKPRKRDREPRHDPDAPSVNEQAQRSYYDKYYGS